MPYRLINIKTNEYLKDLSLDPPEVEVFNNGKDCIEHYERNCKGMDNIVIEPRFEAQCKCKEPLLEFSFNTDYCKRCDNLVKNVV